MLNITNLSADYGGKPALEAINLTLDSGELLVVLGPSGCGKTTLLNLSPGLYRISTARSNWKGNGSRGRAQSAAWFSRTKGYSRGETFRKTLRLVCNWPV